MSEAQATSFYELAPWLQGWFHPDRKGSVAFSSPAGEAAFDHLAQGWGKTPLPELLGACADRFGEATALAVIDRVVAENVRREWAELAAREGKNGVADLARLLLHPLQGAPGWSFTLSEERGGLQLRCTACPHATLGRALGISRWIAHLVCGGDPHLVAGFNPRMGFHRTRMLTTGHDHCDHFYFMREA
jgi:hypothetical protein